MTDTGRGTTRQRKQARQARRALSDDERDSRSLDIAAVVCRMPAFLSATDIGCYLPLAEEVNTWPIIERAWRMKKRVFVPVVDRRHQLRFIRLEKNSALKRGALGVLEPDSGVLIDRRRLSFIVTPLVAFDTRGHRIGMGGGYYDRAFAFLKGRRFYRRPRLVGVAFACQQVDEIVPKPWDIPLFQTVTEYGKVLSNRR